MPGVLGTDRHVLCKRSKPPPRTADAACIAIHDATQDRFLCKDQAKFDWLPLVEWLSQDLARKCGLVIPECFVVELEANPGLYMFGSKWEGGAEQYAPDILTKVTNPAEFSAIHAFDLLVHNVDRHLNNYLYVQLAGDTVVKAVDHSRCLWFSGWPLPAPPPPAGCNTMQARTTWEATATWNQPVAQVVIERWRNIPKAAIEDTLNLLPPAWVSDEHRDQLLNWWDSAEWDTRTDQVLGALP